MLTSPIAPGRRNNLSGKDQEFAAKRLSRARDLVHQAEAAFHDRWATSLDVREVLVHESFEAVTAVENREILHRMGELDGKRLLDLGCGMGDAAVYFATRGVRVNAVDVSGGMIEVTRKLAQLHGVESELEADRMVAEQLEFEDATFDYVYGNGVLHHVDLEAAIAETLRVLRPGGAAFFIEPLAHNPIINAYRRMARAVRTEDEEPISWSDIRSLASRFPQARIEHCEFHLCTQLIFVWFFAFEGLHPSSVRYWKKIITDAPRYGGAFRWLHRCDRVLLRLLPLLRPMCWNTVLILNRVADAAELGS